MNSFNSKKDDILNDLHSAESRCNSSEIKILETELETLKTQQKVNSIKTEELKGLLENREKIKEITKDELPQEAIQCFEGYSRRFILPEEYKENNFETYACIEHRLPEPYTTYLALQEKKSNEIVEKDIYIFEQNKQGKKIGNGEIRLGIIYKNDMKDFYQNKPFVGFTSTEEEYKHKGYGTSRIKHMNEISKHFLGMTLHSDVLFSDDKAKKVRERLEKEGLAKRYEEDGLDRFYFLK